MKALLIIDMQKAAFTPQTPRCDAENVIDRINRISDLFRKNGDPVIFIQHDGTRENYMFPGSEEWDILDELNRSPQDVIISKEANDSFYATRLNSFLQEHKIDELVITGCATDYCVEATVQSALVHDYNQTIVSDAHTTADRPHVQASQLIAHYNWIWANLTPTKGTVSVVNANDFEKQYRSIQSLSILNLMR